MAFPFNSCKPCTQTFCGQFWTLEKKSRKALHAAWRMVPSVLSAQSGLSLDKDLDLEPIFTGFSKKLRLVGWQAAGTEGMGKKIGLLDIAKWVKGDFAKISF